MSIPLMHRSRLTGSENPLRFRPDACVRWQASLTHICITNAFHGCDATVTSLNLLLPLVLVSDLIDHVGGVLESFLEFV